VCVAEVAVPARLAGVVASPQSTAIVETVPSESDVENVRVTDCPVSAGFGDELVMLTVGDLSFTVTEDEADPVEPPLSVAVITIVNDCDLVLPVFAKLCVADVEVPGRLMIAPSPQAIVKEETVPSGSVAAKLTVTGAPVRTGFGETLLIVMVGARSLTVSDVEPEPDPALFVAVTTIVKV
jgi:hypothetical protein